MHGLDGTDQGNVELPPMTSLGGITGDPEHEEAYVWVESYVIPPRMLRVTPADRRTRTWNADAPPFDPSRYQTTQVFYRSKDGTRVPMFVTHKKGLALDGQNPTILYGYGGFSSSQAPYFSPTQVAWFERGGVLAVANIRGGAEYGVEWHKAGVRGLKQNVFDDFIAAAEHLIAERITSRKRLAIRGGSNGGLLVAAVALQRPDLFGGVLVEVGVLDMLRYHKFTVGHLWAGEYGASDDPAAFKWLHRYSPLHNVRFGVRYPAMLITTADHDDRVVPAHSYKFTAAVQTAQAGHAPILLRVQTRAGHGVGKPLGAKLDEDADKLGFLLRVMEAE